MSLHRRIAAAAAFAVAAVCLIFAPVGYFTTRAKLYPGGETRALAAGAPIPAASPRSTMGRNGGRRGSAEWRQPGTRRQPGGGDQDADNASCTFDHQPGQNGGGDRARRAPPVTSRSVCPNGSVIALNGKKPEAACDPPRAQGRRPHPDRRLLLHGRGRRHPRGDLRASRPRRQARRSRSQFR